jgi:hypothetical protein
VNKFKAGDLVSARPRMMAADIGPWRGIVTSVCPNPWYYRIFWFRDPDDHPVDGNDLMKVEVEA